MANYKHKNILRTLSVFQYSTGLIANLQQPVVSSFKRDYFCVSRLY